MPAKKRRDRSSKPHVESVGAGEVTKAYVPSWIVVPCLLCAAACAWHACWSDNGNALPHVDAGLASLTFGDNLSLFEFGASVPFAVHSSIALEEASRELRWDFPNFTKRVMIRQLSGLVHPDEAAKMICTLPREFSRESDTVDRLPSYEHYLYHHERLAIPSHTPARVVELSQRIIDNRLLPYVRERYKCPHCRVCSSLVRRYVAGERLRHPPHYDTQAFITVVVSLTTQHEHFLGGLYVRTDPGTEQFMPGGVGTAVLHQHDLEHGVWVQAGTRYSWILWLQDTPACSGGRASWYKEAAVLGDPVAQQHMSTIEKKPEAAAAWLHKSAGQGYARAQHKLGSAYLTGKGVQQNETTSLRWLQAAADQNSTFAAYAVGWMVEVGVGKERDRWQPPSILSRRSSSLTVSWTCWTSAVVPVPSRTSLSEPRRA